MILTTKKPDMPNPAQQDEITREIEVSEKISAILAEMDNDGMAEATVKIKKQENGIWEQIDECQADAIPSQHETGLKYGAGKYQFIFCWPSKTKKGNNIRQAQFVLGNNYNKLKAEREKKLREESGYANPVSAPAQNNNDEFYKMMFANMKAENDRLNSILLKLIERPQANNGSDRLQDFYLQDLSARSMLTMEKTDEAFKLGLQMGQQSKGAEAEENNTTRIIELIADAAPKILSAFATKNRVKSEIAKTPGAREFLQNPDNVKKVYDGLSQKLGPEKAAAIAAKADININGFKKELNLKVI